MRQLADVGRIRQFMRAFARAASMPGKVFFTGGATAVLLGWRSSTIDVDIILVPRLYRHPAIDARHLRGPSTRRWEAGSSC
jgi:hypothetical protein